jgi:hypothetical protein
MGTDRLCYPPCHDDLAGSTMVAPRPGRWKAVAIRLGATLGVFAAAWVAIGTLHAHGEADEADEVDAPDVALVSDAKASDVATPAPTVVEHEPPSVEPEPPAVEPEPPAVEPEPPAVEPAVAARPRPDLTAAPQGDDTPDRASRTARLEASFAQGRIRGLDLLLITYPSRRSAMRTSAEKACAATTEGGLDQWRLPTPSELATLAQAGFISKYTMWWTGTDESTSVRTMWTGSRTLAKSSPRRSRAKVVCVTERPL